MGFPPNQTVCIKWLRQDKNAESICRFVQESLKPPAQSYYCTKDVDKQYQGCPLMYFNYNTPDDAQRAKTRIERWIEQEYAKLWVSEGHEKPIVYSKDRPQQPMQFPPNQTVCLKWLRQDNAIGEVCRHVQNNIKPMAIYYKIAKDADEKYNGSPLIYFNYHSPDNAFRAKDMIEKWIEHEFRTAWGPAGYEKPVVYVKGDKPQGRSYFSVWLGNVPVGTQPLELQEVFSQFGELFSGPQPQAVKILDEAAFINFACLEAAVLALQACKNKQVRIGGSILQSKPERYTKYVFEVLHIFHQRDVTNLCFEDVESLAKQMHSTLDGLSVLSKLPNLFVCDHAARIIYLTGRQGAEQIEALQGRRDTGVRSPPASQPLSPNQGPQSRSPSIPSPSPPQPQMPETFNQSVPQPPPMALPPPLPQNPHHLEEDDITRMLPMGFALEAGIQAGGPVGMRVEGSEELRIEEPAAPLRGQTSQPAGHTNFSKVMTLVEVTAREVMEEVFLTLWRETNPNGDWYNDLNSNVMSVLNQQEPGRLSQEDSSKLFSGNVQIWNIPVLASVLTSSNIKSYLRIADPRAEPLSQSGAQMLRNLQESHGLPIDERLVLGAGSGSVEAIELIVRIRAFVFQNPLLEFDVFKAVWGFLLRAILTLADLLGNPGVTKFEQKINSLWTSGLAPNSSDSGFPAPPASSGFPAPQAPEAPQALEAPQASAPEAPQASEWSVDRVAAKLDEIGLGMYTRAFKDESIDQYNLQFIEDLWDDLGVQKKGHRLKILNALGLKR